MKLFSALLCSLFFSLACAYGAPADGTLVFEHDAQHVHLHWLAPPRVDGEAVLAVQWMNNSPHGPADPAGTFTAELWMPAMGHGSSPVTIERALDGQGRPVPGAFRVSRMYFLMEGGWEVRVTLVRANGTRETKAWPVTVGSGMAAPEGARP
jgi:hypothetical protein